jgi:hypothetical protein
MSCSNQPYSQWNLTSKDESPADEKSTACCGDQANLSAAMVAVIRL